MEPYGCFVLFFSLRGFARKREHCITLLFQVLCASGVCRAEESGAAVRVLHVSVQLRGPGRSSEGGQTLAFIFKLGGQEFPRNATLLRFVLL